MQSLVLHTEVLNRFSSNSFLWLTQNCRIFHWETQTASCTSTPQYVEGNSHYLKSKRRQWFKQFSGGCKLRKLTRLRYHKSRQKFRRAAGVVSASVRTDNDWQWKLSHRTQSNQDQCRIIWHATSYLNCLWIKPSAIGSYSADQQSRLSQLDTSQRAGYIATTD